MRITAIEKQQRRRRANIYVDGRFALSLSLEVIADAGLRLGDDLSDERIEALREADVRQLALQAALRLLAYRPRSEAEMRSRLARRRLPEPVIQETMERLRRLGLVDDAAFARFWVESRDQSRPRGRRLLAHELWAKGIEPEVTREAVAAVAEDDAAYRAGQGKARALAGQEYAVFRRRLGDFLLRRGFAWETVRSTVDRLWREVSANSPPACGGDRFDL